MRVFEVEQMSLRFAAFLPSMFLIAEPPRHYYSSKIRLMRIFYTIATLVFVSVFSQNSVADIWKCEKDNGEKRFTSSKYEAESGALGVCKILTVTPNFTQPSPRTTAPLPKLRCYEEVGTRKHLCIDERAVTANGDTRASPLYSGGPKGQQKTSDFFVTNCVKKISTLQDRYGVNVAGAFSTSSPAEKSLSQWTCDVAKPRNDLTLKL